MKWVALAVALALFLPFAEWMRRHPRYIPWLWMCIGIVPFAQSAVSELGMAIVAWKDWPGFAKGIDISALDLILVGAYFSLPRKRFRLPFVFSMLFYMVAVLLSAVQAQMPEATLFYAWQLARIFIVYAIVAKASADPRLVTALLSGMAIGLMAEAFVVVYQRFATNALQPTGTFTHQNLLGMVSHFVNFPCFAMLLIGYPGWPFLMAPPLGAVVAVLTASRATIGLTGIGYTFLLIISSLGQWTLRKGLLAMVGVVVVIALIPVAWSSLERRTGTNLRMGVNLSVNPMYGDYDERGAFETAASEMLTNHPMGIGANNFVFIANADGYYERSGVARRVESRGGHVHNVYWLTAAETGYLGLIAFINLLIRPLAAAFACGWQNRRDWRGELLLGFGTALLIVYMHCFYEWVFVTMQVQYVFAISIGMVVGLADQLGYWQRAPVRRRRVPERALSPPIGSVSEGGSAGRPAGRASNWRA